MMRIRQKAAEVMESAAANGDLQPERAGQEGLEAAGQGGEKREGRVEGAVGQRQTAKVVEEDGFSGAGKRDAEVGLEGVRELVAACVVART